MPRSTRKMNKNGKPSRTRTSFKEKVSEALELPKELVLDVPRITLIGNKQLILENYKGIIEYEDSRIRVKTSEGIIKMEGISMIIKEITSEDIMVKGEIKIIQFEQ